MKIEKSCIMAMKCIARQSLLKMCNNTTMKELANLSSSPYQRKVVSNCTYHECDA